MELPDGQGCQRERLGCSSNVPAIVPGVCAIPRTCWDQIEVRIDGDCDGVQDPPCSCRDVGAPCACDGTIVCDNGRPRCNYGRPVAGEVCDGIDNDCDGVLDNGMDGFCAMRTTADGCSGEAGCSCAGGAECAAGQRCCPRAGGCVDIGVVHCTDCFGACRRGDTCVNQRCCPAGELCLGDFDATML